MMRGVGIAILAAVAPVGPGAAQRDAPAREPLQARSFYPPEYRVELFVDLARMRDNGMVDGVARTVLAAGEFTFHEHFGFRLADVDTLRLALGKRSDRVRGIPAEWMIALQGSAAVGVPRFGGFWEGQRVEELDLGGQRVFRKAALNRDRGDLLYLVPREGLLICGNEELITGILLGRRKAGVPAPELATFTHERGNLAYFVGAAELLTLKGVLGVLPLDWRRDSDPLTWFTMRLREDRPDENVRLEAVARFERGGAGVAALDRAVADGLEWLGGHRQLAGLRAYWKRVEVRRRERDLEVGLDLGRPRIAAGALIQLATPLWLWALTSDEVTVPGESVPVRPRRDG